MDVSSGEQLPCRVLLTGIAVGVYVGVHKHTEETVPREGGGLNTWRARHAWSGFFWSVRAAFAEMVNK